jgi:hypothetical protein
MTTALEKIEKQALAEIKDYSTGKKYFVSKFQDSVRKRNIKAKKKLIGIGNAGALSGAGPLEEVELDEGILDWLGLTKKQEEERYTDYSQPIPDIPLWIGAFPLKEMDEARKKFDVIILMANDVVDLAQRFQSQKYQQYKNEGFIIDDYAIQDVETDPGGEDQKIKDAGKLALSLVAPQGNQEPKKVLITCAQGLNRSAAATCLTLQGLGISAQDAYQAIQTSRTAKKQALEMIKAQQSQSRPRTLGNQAFMLHGHPHERFLKLVGIDTENVALEERIRKLIAQTLKEYYNR